MNGLLTGRSTAEEDTGQPPKNRKREMRPPPPQAPLVKPSHQAVVGTISQGKAAVRVWDTRANCGEPHIRKRKPNVKVAEGGRPLGETMLQHRPAPNRPLSGIPADSKPETKR